MGRVAPGTAVVGVMEGKRAATFCWDDDEKAMSLILRRLAGEEREVSGLATGDLVYPRTRARTRVRVRQDTADRRGSSKTSPQTTQPSTDGSKLAQTCGAESEDLTRRSADDADQR